MGGPKTGIAVNGRRAAASPEPGQFAKIDRTWRNGDRIEVEFDVPTTLEAVDPQYPDLVAPVHGPLALFTVGEIPVTVRKDELKAVTQIAAGSTDWQAKTASGTLTLLRPFAAIHNEHFRLHVKVGT